MLTFWSFLLLQINFQFNIMTLAALRSKVVLAKTFSSGLKQSPKILWSLPWYLYKWNFCYGWTNLTPRIDYRLIRVFYLIDVATSPLEDWLSPTIIDKFNRWRHDFSVGFRSSEIVFLLGHLIGGAKLIVSLVDFSCFHPFL